MLKIENELLSGVINKRIPNMEHRNYSKQKIRKNKKSRNELEEKTV